MDLQKGKGRPGLPGLKLGAAPAQGQVNSLIYGFYRTHVHMGSDHWVAMSLTHYKTFLKPCEDLVKSVNVVNVVKT